MNHWCLTVVLYLKGFLHTPLNNLPLKAEGFFFQNYLVFGSEKTFFYFFSPS